MPAAPLWQPSYSYTAGSFVRTSTSQGAGLLFRCVISGTSGTSEPIWPTSIGSNIVDGSVTWLTVSLISGDLQPYNPSAIIELYELQLKAALHGSNDIYRFHAGVNEKYNASDIVWAGNTYSAYPIETDGFEYSGTGQLPRPKLRVSNQFGLITAILLVVNDPVTGTPGNDLIGATVTRIRVLAKHLDAVNFVGNVNPYGTPDPTAEFPREIYSIARKSSENRDIVEFELASAFDLAGVNAPRRLCISNICNWEYRSAECGYTGNAYFDDNDQPVGTLAEDVCSKRLAGCEARFAPVVFAATVSSGSTTLSGISSTSLSSISVGDPVYGHGIPAGTTVVSKGSSSLVMSQAATSNQVYTRTGTLGTTGTTMTVSSATELIAGMAVSGQDVPPGTTIQSISGNVLTLSIAYNPNTKGSSVTRPAKVQKPVTIGMPEYWLITNTSGITVGRLAGNNAGVTTEQPHGTGVYAGTKVSIVNGNVSIGISTKSKLDNGQEFTAIFWTPKTFTQASYTFTASNSYTARANNDLPYGGFPGVGGYY